MLKSSIFSEELVEEFEQYTEITDYKLRSVRFSMEGVKIPSFVGECTIRIRGPQQMVNVAHMLAHFGEFSGVGIKTGLGMGALSVREIPFNMRHKVKTDTNQTQQTGKRGD